MLTGDKTKASVARVTGTGAKIWETELYNNPSFGAASIEIVAGDGGELYVTGMTELNFDDQLLMNSWIAALSSGGNVLWKDYLENSNSGEEVAFDGFSGLLVMNMNCGTINYISLPDGMITDRIRVYDVCDPYDTGALLRSMAVNPQGDYFMAGARSGNFYYALRKGIVYDNQQ
ncbi:MAG: hypothetical protein R2727_09340 [Bacteroidales bacterium]